MDVFPASVYIPYAHSGQKRALDALELEVQTALWVLALELWFFGRLG